MSIRMRRWSTTLYLTLAVPVERRGAGCRAVQQGAFCEDVTQSTRKHVIKVANQGADMSGDSTAEF